MVNTIFSKIIIFLLLFNMVVSVDFERRILMPDSDTGFYTSVDSFKNIGKNKINCTELNATCSTPSCDICKCSEVKTSFVSIEDGCIKQTVINDYFNAGSPCVIYDGNEDIIPMVKYNDTTCKSIDIEVLLNDSCSARTIFNLNERTVYQLDENVNQAVIEIENSISGKCIKFKNFASLESIIGGVNINCYYNFSTCFIFKVEGNFVKEAVVSTTTPVTTLKATAVSSTTSNQVGKTSGSDNNIVIGVVIAIVVLIIFVAVVAYVLYRRKQTDKKKLSHKMNPMNDPESLNGSKSNHYKSLTTPISNQKSQVHYTDIQPKDMKIENEYQYAAHYPRSKEDPEVKKIDNPLYIVGADKDPNNRDSRTENPLYGSAEYVDTDINTVTNQDKNPLPVLEDIYTEVDKSKNNQSERVSNILPNYVDMKDSQLNAEYAEVKGKKNDDVYEDMGP